MRLRVYLVLFDDERATARSARLIGEGWTVFTECKDGEDAYQQIRKNKPDLVVFDLATSPLLSLQVSEALRKCISLNSLPFLFVDGDARFRHAAQQRVVNAQFTTSEDLVKDIKLVAGNLVPCPA